MANGMGGPEDELKEISVSEFFEKNRHLLGFNNKNKAIITCIKEAVDNSLDATEENDILPDIRVDIQEIGENRLRWRVIDNGPGLTKEHIPQVFGKLLYGSKFHRLQQSRGQQGIGISASALYAQLTTGNPVRIYSKKDGHDPHMFKLKLDTKKNEPDILDEQVVDNFLHDHGTSIEMDVEARYSRGSHSVFEYIKQTAIMNPYAYFELKEPGGNKIEFSRGSTQLPPQPKEIKPHPHGVELGVLMRMLDDTDARTIVSFLTTEFSSVGRKTGEKICNKARIKPKKRPSSLSKKKIELLLEAMQNTSIQNPPTNCLAPIGEDLILKGMKKELNPEFVEAVTRSPAVYRGMPFQVEVAVAYGGDLEQEGGFNLYRFANKVPLLYNRGACACYEAVGDVDWNRYNISQSGGYPKGPVSVLVHFASVWVPFTSEGKEAISPYPQINKEIKLALQEAGRKLKTYLGKKEKAKEQELKRKKLTSYSKELAPALAKLTGSNAENLHEEIQELLAEQVATIELEEIQADTEDTDDGEERIKEVSAEER